ncbi:Phosphotyrosine protein phosphatase [Mycena kentingensis (nom. inval.)]|nr:Phosphotyrosine protein phosphatase [Mycena kentingensis (nom. inval.)]
MSQGAPIARVLVVCLGNICRSPMGEAVLAAHAKERGIDIEVDSCGTAGYHAGEEPDERTLITCKKHGVPIDHKSRKLRLTDFKNFTHILASDESNLRDIERAKPKDSTAVVRLWGSYLDGRPIPDPWYGGTSGFELTFKQCTALSKAFLDDLVGE